MLQRRQLRYLLLLEATKHRNLRAQGLEFQGASLKMIDRRSCHYIRPAHGITNKSLVHFFFCSGFVVFVQKLVRSTSKKGKLYGTIKCTTKKNHNISK